MGLGIGIKHKLYLSLILCLILLTLVLRQVFLTDPALLIKAPTTTNPAAQVPVPGLHVLSFATNPKHPILQFLLSTTPYPVEILGKNQKWRGLRDKFEAVRAYLEKNHLEHSQEIIVFVDGYDVVFTQAKQDIVKKFKAFNKPIVISAERACTHHPICSNLASHPKGPENTPFKYLNSGTYIGYASAIYAMLDEVLKRHPTAMDDQFLMYDFFITHPEGVVLDYYQEIFSLLFGTQFKDYAFDPKTKSITNLVTHSEPLVLHGNGGPGILLKLYKTYIAAPEGKWADWVYHTDLYIRWMLVWAMSELTVHTYNSWMYYQEKHYDGFARVALKMMQLEGTLRQML